MTNFRISPLWYPLLIIASPVIIPLLLYKNYQFKRNKDKVSKINGKRLEEAHHIEIPEIHSLELTVLVEWRAKEDFIGDAGVSYLFRTELGSMLYDVGFGFERPTLLHNADKLDINFEQIDDLTISHLHPDHMGGFKALREKQVVAPENFKYSGNKHCFLPDKATIEGLNASIVNKPQLLSSGIASTGALACSLFFGGFTEEQVIVVKLKNKGLVVFTGCGHPGIETILKMVRKISDEPIYAIGGGLHFPVTQGRGNIAGIQIQRIVGTGKPPWKKINVEDLNNAIKHINNANPKKVFLSAHDTCDYSLKYLSEGLNADTIVLKAGEKYII